MGDALAAFNPIYGHGMSGAARSAVVLDRTLRKYQLAAGTSTAAQKAIGETVDDPWVLSTSADVRYPECRTDVTDSRLRRRSEEGEELADLIANAAASDPVVNAATTKVSTLSAPASTLQTPQVLTAVRRGPRYQPHPEPPLNDDELAVIKKGKAAYEARIATDV